MERKREKKNLAGFINGASAVETEQEKWSSENDVKKGTNLSLYNTLFKEFSSKVKKESNGKEYPSDYFNKWMEEYLYGDKKQEKIK